MKGDPDTKRGTLTAIGQVFGIKHNPLLIDAAADAAFASSIRRLRDVPGTHKGKHHD